MSKIVVEMTGEEARLHQAVMAAAADMAKLEQGVDRVGQRSAKAAREEQALAREAKRVYDDTRTPQEQYNARMERLGDLLKRGKIDQDTFARASKNAGDALQRAGRDGEKSFGGMGSAIAGGIKQLIGVAGPMAAVVKLMREMNAAREEAAAASKSAAPGFGALSQLALVEEGGKVRVDPDRAAELRRTARDIYAAGGADSQQQAAQLTFALASAGMEGEADYFARLKASELVADPAAMVQSIRAMQTAFGEQQAGTARQLIDKGVIASRLAPASIQELITGAARTAKFAPAAGVSDVEALAAVAATSEPMKGAAEASTAVTSLFASLGRIGAGQIGATVDEETGEMVAAPDSAELTGLKAKLAGRIDFRGRGLMEQLQQIEALGLDPAEMQKLFGQKAIAGYRFLMERRGDYGDVVRQIGALDGRSLSEELMALIGEDPSAAAALAARREKSRREVASEPLGIQKNLLDSARDAYAADLRAGKSKPTFVGAEADIAAMGLGSYFDWIPGMRREQLVDFYYRGKINDPKLRGQVAAELGLTAEEAAAADKHQGMGASNQPPNDATRGLVEATDNLRAAAASLERSQRSFPTLARPDDE